MLMNRKLIYIIAALCAVACSKAYELDREIKELAAARDEYVIGMDGADCVIPVFSNGLVNISLMDADSDWAGLEKTSLTGDGSVMVKVKDNKGGVPRMVAVLLSLEEKGLKDTVYIKQEGLPQSLSCPLYVTGAEGTRPNLSQTADGKEEATLEYAVSLSNIPAEELKLDVEYLDYKGGWLSSYAFSEDKVNVVLAPNDTEISRRASLTLYYIDGWNRRIETKMYVAQSDNEGNVGMDITPMEVRLLAEEGGFKVNDDYVIEGTVISDCSSRNMELNPLLDYNVLDSLASLRTAYIQTAEEGQGFKLVFDDVQDNALTFGTKVKINLYGTTLIKETNPDRCTISGLKGNNLVEMSIGSVTPKEKKISQLTPDDIYTYVTLTDTEFAFKRGSYLDIAEHNSYKFMDGWASLLIDDEGSSIYAPVNVNCAWRRTGEGLPQGSGNTTGIIVSHKMPRIGDAGLYQIRVLDKTGFAQGEQTGWINHAEWFNSYKDRNHYADTAKNPATIRYMLPEGSTGKDAIVPSIDIVNKLSGGQSLLANGEYYCENTEDGRGGKTTYDSGVYYIDKNSGADGNVGKGVAWMHKLHGWYQWDDNKIKDYNGFIFTFQNLPSDASLYMFSFDFGFGNLNEISWAHTHPVHWCLEYKDFTSGAWVLIQKDVNMFTDPQERNYVHMRALPWPSGFVSGSNYHTGAETGMGFTQHAFLLPEVACQDDGLQLRLRPYDNRIARLTVGYLEDSEDAHATPTTDISNGLRLRFGTIALRYR